MSGPAAEWRRPSSLQPLMFFTHTTMMMLAALVPSAAAAGNASDYVTVPGVFFPGSISQRQQESCRRRLAWCVCARATKGLSHSDARFARTPSQVFMAIPGVPLPEVPILWIGEANNADQVLLDDPSVPPTSSTRQLSGRWQIRTRPPLFTCTAAARPPSELS